VPHSNRERNSRQAGSVVRQLAQAPGLPFASLLPQDQVEQILREEKVSWSERLYTPVVTLWVFLSQILDPDHSMRPAVARLVAHRVQNGQQPCSADTGAYAKARQRLPERVLVRLTQQTGQLPAEIPGGWRWHNRHVKVVDGSTASMPDTAANQQAYPQSKTQKAGVGFPVLRFVVLFSLSVGTVLEAAIGPYKGKQTGETALFRSLHPKLNEDDILLADRYYCSYFEIALLRERRVDIVMRLHQHRRADFRRGRRLGRYDHIVTWSKPKNRPDWLDQETYDRLPATLTLRQLKVTVDSKVSRSRSIVVVTSLLDGKLYPKADVAELYRARWHAELNLRSLKTTLQMDILRGKTPATVRKEIWMHLLAYNLIRQTMVQAAKEHNLEPATISFKGTLQMLNAFVLPLQTSSAENLPAVCQALWQALVAHRVADRPDRVEPRARKRRPKPYPLLQEPRKKALRKERKGLKA
jgi:DDE family transposase